MKHFLAVTVRMCLAPFSSAPSRVSCAVLLALNTLCMCVVPCVNSLVASSLFAVVDFNSHDACRNVLHLLNFTGPAVKL